MQPILYRKINELVDRYAHNPSGKKEQWVKSFFQSLDWGKNEGFSIVADGTKDYKLLVDNFPTVNVLTSSPDNIDVVYSAINKAYNQDVPWVVATDFRSLGLFGTYWVCQKHDIYTAQAFKLDQSIYLAESHNLELLAPYSVGKNGLDQLYSQFPGRKKRLPIDMHLVERMSKWRQLGIEAMHRNDPQTDWLIHRLLNTLFLTRYVEDIGQEKDKTLLEIAQESNAKIFSELLANTFSKIGKRTNYQTISAVELKKLGDTPLKNLINQLYGYPDYGITYNFAEISVDILGRFYEEYLRLDVVPTKKKTVNLNLFPSKIFDTEDVRHQKGIYYTPRFIVDYILNSLIHRFKTNGYANRLPYILDLSCGSGTFLSAGMDHLIGQFNIKPTKVSQLSDYLIGFDNDQRAVEAARLNLAMRSLFHGSKDPLRTLNVHCIDLIKGGPTQKAIQEKLPNTGVNIIVGNPPYIHYETLSNKYDVRNISTMFPISSGRTDSYVLFVEAALRILHRGGLAGLVLPNNIFRSKAADGLREYLAQESDILEIVDFVDQPVFKGVGTYVCVILFRKKDIGIQTPQISVTKVNSLSDTPGTQLANAIASSHPPEGVDVFTVPQPQGRSPWIFRNSFENSLLERLNVQSSVIVEDILTLRQGIKTGDDEIFIVTPNVSDRGNITIKKGSETFFLELELLKPVLRIRDITRWFVHATDYLILPYNREGKLYPWNEIENKYSGIAKYLLSNKKKLSQRNSLQGKKWYDLIRPRIEMISSTGERLISSEIGNRPIIAKPSSIETVVVGNYWLVQNDANYDLDVLMAFMNSSISEWFLKQTSTRLQGGYLLVRGNNLSKLPIPDILKDSASFVFSELKRLCKEIVLSRSQSSGPLSWAIRNSIRKTEDQIDSLLFEALHLSSAEAEYLRKSISPIKE